MKDWDGEAVSVAPSLLEDTYLQLRACGQQRRECHLFWIASCRDPHHITRVVHPRHIATSVSIEIDTDWLNSFFLELADRRECIRVQVHSHPGAAFHSGTDDSWPAVRMRGYLSLVVPNFATGEPDLDGAYLAEQDENGSWLEGDVKERVRIQPALPTALES